MLNGKSIFGDKMIDLQKNLFIITPPYKAGDRQNRGFLGKNRLGVK